MWYPCIETPQPVVISYNLPARLLIQSLTVNNFPIHVHSHLCITIRGTTVTYMFVYVYISVLAVCTYDSDIVQNDNIIVNNC